MQYRNVGGSGLKVSEIALGSWMTRLEDAAAVDIAMDIAHKAFDAGVNFFDCADAYSGGDAEVFLGRFIKDLPREDVVISSKVFFKTGNSVNGGGLSRKHILNNCERSLKNLGTDYIDLYYCHRFDPDTPMEETLQTLSDLVDQGKILYYGVSEEWSAARLERAQRIIRTGIASVDRCPAGIQHDEPAYRLNVGCVWLRAEVSFSALSLSS